MRELMRLSLTSGVLSTHQYLIARIQTQFSRDTNVIDSLKTDLKKQVDETEELKHCLSHLTLASKRLEVKCNRLRVLTNRSLQTFGMKDENNSGIFYFVVLLICVF